VVLSPRRPITAAPYALYAKSAPWSGLAGVPAGFADGVDNTSAYVRTVVVSPVGTDLQNGTALRNALEGITTASPTNRYLLKIEPGTYDLGTFSPGNPPLRMKPYVDIEGSGELATKITGTSPGGGAVEGANWTELRFLTVEVRGSGGAIFNNSVSARLTHVTITALGTTGSVTGVYNNGPLTMNDVTIDVSGSFDGAGVRNNSQSLSMDSVTINLSGSGNANIGLENNYTFPYALLNDVTIKVYGAAFNMGIITGTGGGRVEVHHSAITILGTGSSLQNASGSFIDVGASQVAGPVDNQGSVTCAASYSRDYRQLKPDCTP
ncbi:MAG: hypothetical protein M3328_12880, partial [Chloroflexota bacterium]|nr:hypothetical protein [Chloroflexota bacterium]